MFSIMLEPNKQLGFKSGKLRNMLARRINYLQWDLWWQGDRIFEASKTKLERLWNTALSYRANSCYITNLQFMYSACCMRLLHPQPLLWINNNYHKTKKENRWFLGSKSPLCKVIPLGNKVNRMNVFNLWHHSCTEVATISNSIQSPALIKIFVLSVIANHCGCW